MNRQELLLLTATAAGSAIFGFLVGGTENIQHEFPREPAPNADEFLETLPAEIQKLGDLLSEVSQRLAQLEAKPRVLLHKEEADRETSPTIDELLERCTSLLERMESRGGPALSGSAQLFFNSPSASLENLRQFPRTEAGERAFNEGHSLWTMQQVLDRFGTPTEIEGGGGGTMTWWYKPQFAGDEDTSWSFGFASGLVAEATIWYGD